MKLLVGMCLLVLTGAGLTAQTTFTRLTQSPAVNPLADSRSVHVVDLNMDGLDDIFITNGPSGGLPTLCISTTTAAT
jgi:hypothetical protein